MYFHLFDVVFKAQIILRVHPAILANLQYNMSFDVDLKDIVAQSVLRSARRYFRRLILQQFQSGVRCHHERYVNHRLR